MHNYLSRLSLYLLISGFLASKALWSASLEVEQDSTAIAPSASIPLVSYADVIDRAAPAVVSVYTTDIQTYSRSQQSEIGEVLRQYGYRMPYGRAIPEQREVHGLGSGVIISRDGYIITNNHVVRDQGGEPVDEIRVQLKDGAEYFAELIGTDEKTDVADQNRY